MAGISICRLDPSGYPVFRHITIQKAYFVTMMRVSRGFTLIELMITIAVIAITLTLAVHSARPLLINNRLVGQANDFITALQFARTEAIKRGKGVTVCSSTTLTGCSSSTNWANGYIAFLDTDSDATVDAGDTLLRVWPLLEGAPTFTGNVSSVRYMGTGFSWEFTRSSPTTYAFTLTASGCTGTESRVIDINAIGRPLVTKTAC